MEKVDKTMAELHLARSYLKSSQIVLRDRRLHLVHANQTSSSFTKPHKTRPDRSDQITPTNPDQTRANPATADHTMPGHARPAHATTKPCKASLSQTDSDQTRPCPTKSNRARPEDTTIEAQSDDMEILMVFGAQN
jgi:hypothetical protein